MFTTYMSQPLHKIHRKSVKCNILIAQSQFSLKTTASYKNYRFYLTNLHTKNETIIRQKYNLYQIMAVSNNTYNMWKSPRMKNRKTINFLHLYSRCWIFIKVFMEQILRNTTWNTVVHFTNPPPHPQCNKNVCVYCLYTSLFFHIFIIF